MASGRTRSPLGGAPGAAPRNTNPNPAPGAGNGTGGGNPGGGGGAPQPNDTKGTVLGVAAAISVLLIIVALVLAIFVGPVVAIALVGIGVLLIIALVVGVLALGGSVMKSDSAGNGSGQESEPVDYPTDKFLKPQPWFLYRRMKTDQALLARTIFGESTTQVDANGMVTSVTGYRLIKGQALLTVWECLKHFYEPRVLVDYSQIQPIAWELEANTTEDKIEIDIQLTARLMEDGDSANPINAVRAITGREGNWGEILKALAKTHLNKAVSGKTAQSVEDDKATISRQITLLANEEAQRMGIKVEISVLAARSIARTMAREQEELEAAKARGRMAGIQQLSPEQLEALGGKDGGAGAMLPLMLLGGLNLGGGNNGGGKKDS